MNGRGLRSALAVYAAYAFSMAMFWQGYTILRDGVGPLTLGPVLSGRFLLTWVLCGLLLGVLALATAWALRRTGAAGPENARALTLAADLPLLFLGLAWPLYPVLARLGQGLHLDILGWVKLPWEAAFTHLAPPVYLYLLWAGLWLTLSWFLKFAAGVRGFLQRTNGSSARPGALFILGAVFYLGLSVWTTTVYPPTGDEPHYLLAARSLVADHDLDLRNNLEAKDFARDYPADALDFHTAPSPGPALRSKHFPTLSWLIALPVAGLGRWGASALIALCAALAAALVFGLARALGARQDLSVLAWAAAMLGPPLLFYFDLIYTELPAAVLILGGLAAALGGRRSGVPVAVLAALALPWFYPKYLPAAAVLGLGALWVARARWTTWLWAGLAAGMDGAGYFIFFKHWYAFGLGDNPFGTLSSVFSLTAFQHFLGLLVDRDFGIVPAAPLMLIAGLGLAVLWRARRAAAVWVLAILIVQIGLYTVFEDFTGSSAAFSRHLVPGLLPALAALPFGLERLTARPAGRAWTAGLVLAGMLVGWTCAAWPVLRYLAPKQVLWSKLGFEPYLFPSLALHPNAWTYAWALVWLGILVWGLSRANRTFSGPGGPAR